MDRFHELQVFVAIVDEGSLSEAARHLGLSPPAVSRAIDALEKRLAVRLLTRSTRSVRVTEAGAAYADECRRILADLQEADEQVTGLHGALRGRLTVTAPMLLGSRYVMPVVAEYQQAHPAVVVSAWWLDRVVNLLEEGVDVAVRVGELPDSTLQAIRVGQVRRVRVASPAYVAQHGEPQVPEDLLTQHRIVTANALGPTSEWVFHREGRRFTLPLQANVVTTFNDAAAQAAVLGMGVASLLSYQVADLLADGRLVRVLVGTEPPPLPVHLLHREGRQASGKVRAFIDMAVERLRAVPALAAT
jgi:DNA-binding transcriptional LysR family regulator